MLIKKQVIESVLARRTKLYFFLFFLHLNLLMWSERTSGRLSEINDPYFPSEASHRRGQMVGDVRLRLFLFEKATRKQMRDIKISRRETFPEE